MNEVLTFIKEHWRILTVLVINLVLLIVSLFRKKVKIEDVFKSVLLVLPEYISLAEKNFKEGPEKYSFVFNKCVSLLCTLTHKNSGLIIDEYASDINAAIENILSTPQKKER